MKYKQRPIEIEAIRVQDALDLARTKLNELPEWLLEHYGAGEVLLGGINVLIRMPFGYLPVPLVGWLVCAGGSVFPVSEEEFKTLYEPA